MFRSVGGSCGAFAPDAPFGAGFVFVVVLIMMLFFCSWIAGVVPTKRFTDSTDQPARWSWKLVLPAVALARIGAHPAVVSYRLPSRVKSPFPENWFWSAAMRFEIVT